ncbi:MAG: hypothetical protein LUD71_03020 [Clostridiales bacterium]|nr:hypothetical protein [Clostridiales bacterium]
MLNQIKEALEAAFDIPVFYGTSAPATGKNITNYIVFWREKTHWNGSKKADPSCYYTVALVRENFIPEDEETKVFDVLRDISGLKEASNEDVSFDFLVQPETKLFLEVATYHFVAPRKRLPAPEVSE